jgi:hypothetical protein
MLGPVPTKTEISAKMEKPRRKLMIPLYVAIIALVSWALYFVVFESRILGTMQESSFGERLDNTGQTEPHAPLSSSSMTQVLDLPEKHLPQMGKSRSSGRLVVVGDVHGMLDELRELLHTVQFDEQNDHLVLAGDIINKGPDSAGVVDLAMSLGATVVRGNHEDRIIHAHAAMSAKDTPFAPEHHDSDDMHKKESSNEDHFTNRDLKDRKLATHLGDQRICWLKNCPVILRLGDLGEMGQVVVVHAGLQPGVDLLDQDPYMTTNMRTISSTGEPSEKHHGDGWMKVCQLPTSSTMSIFNRLQAWNKYQKSLPKSERTTVIYGHDSKRGLQMEQYSIGIDTGCVKGGRLTAVVIEGGISEYTFKLVQVDCLGERKNSEQ